MGGSKPSKVLYSVPVTQPKQGETAVYRNIDHKDALVSKPRSGVTTMQEIFTHRFKNSPKDNFLGQRPRKADNKNELEEYFEWETWSQVEELSKALGSGITHMKLIPNRKQFRDYDLKFIAIYGKNSREWILTDIACTIFGITSIPIYDTLGEEATDYMFNQTELTTCFLTCSHVAGILKRMAANAVPHLTNIVVMDEWNLTTELTDSVKSNPKITLIKFSDIISKGRENMIALPVVKPNDVYIFSYTSGTTGLPKGAMISHKNMIAGLGGMELAVEVNNPVHLSYLPLAHVFERVMLSWTVIKGGTYGVFNGDVLKLKDDLAILKPTIFPSVPRLYNKFYDKIQAGLRETTGCKSTIAAKAIKTKLENEQATGTYTHCLYDKLVFKKMKAVLGGNVQYMVTASAPISPDVKQFLKVAFSCPFAEGYGQTEGIGGSFVTQPRDNVLGIVGGPLPHNEFKLIDVPEMKYLSTDKDENGLLSPRGEVLVRGDNVISCYYKNEQQTSELVDKDGWLHSGDIGQILPETGALKIIDRRKNIFKLSQGEYVAPDKLEQVYKTTRGVADIFVYGDSFKSVLIAIVNVDPDEIKKLCGENNWNCPDLKSFCSNESVTKWYLDMLSASQKSAGLKGFERISKVFLDPVNFGENGLVTTTFKLKRHDAKIHYQSKIDQMYIGLE